MVREWAPQSWIYARYEGGTDIAGRMVGSTTVKLWDRRYVQDLLGELREDLQCELESFCSIRHVLIDP